MSRPLVALDLDGTIVDAKPRQVAVARAAAYEVLRVEIDGELFWQHKRRGATTVEALRLLAIDDNDAALIAAAWHAGIEAQEWLVLDKPLPGAVEAVRAIADAGCHIAIVTARQRVAGARAVAQALGLTEVAELLVVPPESAVEQKAAALASLDAAAYIGDTESDGEAAARVDVRFVAVGTGQRESDVLIGHGFEVADSLLDAWDRIAAEVGPPAEAG